MSVRASKECFSDPHPCPPTTLSGVCCECWLALLTFCCSAILSLGLTGLGLATLTESVAETTTDNLQVTHSASSSGLPPLGLNRPVVCILITERNKNNHVIEHIADQLKQSNAYRNAAWPLGIRTASTPTSGCGTRSVRNDGTRCASYCGAFQSLMFPSSVQIKSKQT